MRHLREIDIDAVKKVISYDRDTGQFTRIDSGKPAGSLTFHGYIRIGVLSAYVLAHRLAYALVHGYVPPMIDHINGNRADNRIENLRPASRAINSQNVYRANRNSTTGFRGVTWSPRHKKFKARIRVHGNLLELGAFNTAEEAHQAYVNAKSKLHIGFVKERANA